MGIARQALVSAGVAALVAVAGCAAPGGAGKSDRVVYHINEGVEQAANGLRNANNHLSVDPNVQIVVVTHARGVDFLMKGAKDSRGNSFEPVVDRLKMQGVRFEVCEITLENRNLKREQFIDSATYVPSGVGELTRLQQREGYAYVKP